MEPKKLVIYRDFRGNPRMTRLENLNRGRGFIEEIKRFSDGDGYTPSNFPQRLWDLIYKSDLNFGVLEGMPIEIHLDEQTFGDFKFYDGFERVHGYKLRHWTSRPISIDNPRDEYRDIIENAPDMSKMFTKLVVEDDVLKFTYEGPSAVKNRQDIWRDKYLFVYDLYLTKRDGYDPNDATTYIWFDPIIRNDGSPP
ncbi:hypothetical protein GCM10007853_03510 [Algimonas ampicilliniresistens]|uniref:Uncharacterized protein n=1 Tax=Algimonas ampicilliniresistens TaxID=1298735 RepID=A0ABQ5V885_9PROT|nr:hypothetical protein [Algimonas ampicilliniresistens]GLQ22477.1 hypothetical protein GCM10007853_03510 [Algimonas ampicilliniresistens]